jgi:hypothetical protein
MVKNVDSVKTLKFSAGRGCSRLAAERDGGLNACHTGRTASRAQARSRRKSSRTKLTTILPRPRRPGSADLPVPERNSNRSWFETPIGFASACRIKVRSLPHRQRRLLDSTAAFSKSSTVVVEQRIEILTAHGGLSVWYRCDAEFRQPMPRLQLQAEVSKFRIRPRALLPTVQPLCCRRWFRSSPIWYISRLAAATSE